ncbi:hypothetical protein niasHT_012348 [Heterodera trifolii]|uniref:Uncharacterized protein n=2 Tax=Heterodera trifolii TaxID=157864 RepID=A0ABD2KZ60_9BILA
MSGHFGTLTPRLVHPTSPVLLTKNGPLGAQTFNAWVQSQATLASYPFRSDDRFARQNRFGLPPEFPLASSCSGIVHHLSGLSAYALSPPHRMRSRRDYVAPQHRSARDHTSAPRVEQMTGFYTENAQLRARAGPNWLLVRVARDRHRPSARANTDPKPLHNSPRVNSTPPIRVPDPERLASRPSSRSYSEHLSALRLQMPHSPLNRRTANPSLEASSPTYSNKRVNADQIRQLCPFPPHRFHVLFNSLFKVLCNFPSRRIQVILRPDVPPWHTSATALAMCEQLSTHIGPDAGAFVLHRKRRITHVPYWWVNNPTLGEFCFAMIGRADIEGSKSDVAMDAWPPQASYPCGSISHAFAVRIRTENQDQVSICLFALREVSVLSELALGHLRYALTDVPPQSNSPPDTVIGAGRRATGWPDLTPKWTPLRAHSRFTD